MQEKTEQKEKAFPGLLVALAMMAVVFGIVALIKLLTWMAP